MLTRREGENADGDNYCDHDDYNDDSVMVTTFL